MLSKKELSNISMNLEGEHNTTKLVPKKGTILDELVVASSAGLNNTALVEELGDESKYRDYDNGRSEFIYRLFNDHSTKSIEELTSNKTTKKGEENEVTLSRHSCLIEKNVDDLSSLVMSHLNFTKNTVMPLVEDLSKNLQDVKTNLAKENPEINYSIVARGIHPIYENESLKYSLEYYKDKKLFNPPPIPKFAMPTEEEGGTSELLKTGNNKFDKELEAWRDSLLINSDTVFIHCFADTGDKNIFDHNDSYSDFDKMDSYLMAYLMTTKLIAKGKPIDESVVEKTSEDYTRQMEDLKDFLGISICINLKKLKSLIDSKQIIIHSGTKYPNTFLQVVTVVEENYKEWLSKGGTPEFLLGLIVSGDYITTRSLLDSKKDYIAVWESYILLTASKARNNFIYKIRDIISLVFFKMLNELTPEEEEYRKNNPLFLENVKKLFKEEINKFTNEDIDDVNKVATILISKVRFYFTSSYDIICDINEAGKANPKVKARESALLATIKYISRYLVDQISVDE